MKADPIHLDTAWYRRRSRVSLISSSVCTFFLLLGFVLSFWFPIIAFAIGAIVARESTTPRRLCLWLGMLVGGSSSIDTHTYPHIPTVNLAINFAVRLQATRRFMPAGVFTS